MAKSCTTPESLELYGILNQFADDEVKAAVIEVSSQGLQYNRIEYLDFFAGVYLNLSPDHVSPTEHHSFEEYKAAKMRMLTLCENGFLNIDDEYAEDIRQAAACRTLYTFGRNENADFCAKNIKETPYGTEFSLYGKFYNGEKVSIGIPGDFNVSNALAAIAVATVYGIDIKTITDALAKTRIAGRMELYQMEGRTVVIDYAHNKLSFEGIFRYAKRFFGDKRIICLFGCPGNKALDRRKELPLVAGANADHIILTADDPSFEEPEDIIAELEKGIRPFGVSYDKIVDREEALALAAEISREGDLIILAGKGHETTQAVKGKLVPYSGDRAGLEKAFKAQRAARI
jgi:UDP-N-acetylmuramyl-tripeptide synthetase